MSDVTTSPGTPDDEDAAVLADLDQLLAGVGGTKAPEPSPTPVTPKSGKHQVPGDEPDSTCQASSPAPTAPTAAPKPPPRKRPAAKKAAAAPRQKKATPAATSAPVTVAAATSATPPVQPTAPSLEDEVTASAKKFGIEHNWAGGTITKALFTELQKYIDDEVPDSIQLTKEARNAAIKAGLDQAKALDDEDLDEFNSLLTPTGSTVADPKQEKLRTRVWHRLRYLFYAAIFIALLLGWRAIAPEAWRLLLPDLPGPFQRGILIPATDTARWLVFWVALVLAICFFGFALYRTFRKDRQEIVIRKDGKVVHAYEDICTWSKYKIKRWGLVLLAGSMIFAVVAIAAIPFRDVSLSHTNTISQERGLGQLYQIRDIESTAGSLVIMATKAKTPAEKAQLNDQAKIAINEYCRYAKDDTAAVIACQIENVPPGTIAVTTSWPDQTLLVVVIMFLVLVLVVAIILAMWLYSRRGTAPTEPEPSPVPVPTPAP